MKFSTLETLAELEEEMARAGRTHEEAAIRDARRALARTRSDVLTTGQAAERLDISIPTVKRWIERGVLIGGQLGGRWHVATESVERLIRVRETLVDLDREGNPAPDEVRALANRPRVASNGNSANQSGA